MSPGDEDTVQLCALQVGGERYAIDIMRVEEILHPAPLTHVPGAPALVEGVVQLRGEVLPVVDVRRALGLEHRQALGRSSRLVVCRLGQRRLGLLVDGVTGVLRTPISELKPAPMEAGAGRPPWIPGLLRHHQQLYLLLDVLALLEGGPR